VLCQDLILGSLEFTLQREKSSLKAELQRNARGPPTLPVPIQRGPTGTANGTHQKESHKALAALPEIAPYRCCLLFHPSSHKFTAHVY
jgi:hypothetical protein